MWPEGITLKNHASVAFVGRNIGYISFSEVDNSRCGFDEASEHPEKGGFSTTGWSQKKKQFSSVDS
jgi:hypothetical protein